MPNCLIDQEALTPVIIDPKDEEPEAADEAEEDEKASAMNQARVYFTVVNGHHESPKVLPCYSEKSKSSRLEALTIRGPRVRDVVEADLGTYTKGDDWIQWTHPKNGKIYYLPISYSSRMGGKHSWYNRKHQTFLRRAYVYIGMRVMLANGTNMVITRMEEGSFFGKKSGGHRERKMDLNHLSGAMKEGAAVEVLLHGYEGKQGVIYKKEGDPSKPVWLVELTDGSRYKFREADLKMLPGVLRNADDAEQPTTAAADTGATSQTQTQQSIFIPPPPGAAYFRAQSAAQAAVARQQGVQQQGGLSPQAKLLLVAAIVVVLCCLLGGVYMFMGSGPKDKPRRMDHRYSEDLEEPRGRRNSEPRRSRHSDYDQVDDERRERRSRSAHRHSKREDDRERRERRSNAGHNEPRSSHREEPRRSKQEPRRSKQERKSRRESRHHDISVEHHIEREPRHSRRSARVSKRERL